MVKTFITFIDSGHLSRAGFTSPHNSLLNYPSDGGKRISRFPLIAMINGYCQPNDTIKVITIIDSGEPTENVVSQLHKDLGIVCEEKCLTLNYVALHSDDSSDAESKFDLLKELIPHITGDEIFADLTWASVLQSTVINMALTFADKCKKIPVGCIIKFSANVIHDITALYHMNNIVNMMGSGDIKDPEGAMLALIA